MKVKKHSLAMVGKSLVRTVYDYETDHYRWLAVNTYIKMPALTDYDEPVWDWGGYIRYELVEDLIFVDEAVIDLWLKANEGGSMS